MLLRFQNREDYLQVLLKESLFIHGRPFWFSKWTLNFSPDEDSPVVPVWIELPGLPPNFYNRGMLQSIACSIGPVLQIDQNTLCLTRADAARVCVQMDVSKQRPERVWVGAGSNGNWQRIFYPAWPLFCTGCKHLGHESSKCKKKPSHPPDPTARGGDQSWLCAFCKNNSHFTEQCKLKPPSAVQPNAPQGRAIPNSNLNKGKKVVSSDGLAPAPLGTKVTSQIWRSVGAAAPSLESGPSVTPATMQGMALLDSSNSRPDIEVSLLASAPSPGIGPLDAHVSTQAVQPSHNGNSSAPVSTQVMAQNLIPPGFAPAAVDPLGKAPQDSIRAPLVLNAPTTAEEGPTHTGISGSGGSTPPPRGSTPPLEGSSPPPAEVQEASGLLSLLDPPDGPALKTLSAGLATGQTASPTIVHQSSIISRAIPTDSSVRDDPAVALETTDELADDLIDVDTVELESSEGMAHDAPDGDLVEQPESAPALLGTPIVQVLMVPGREPPSRSADVVTAHSNFVGNVSTQSARSGGLPPRAGLRRSASVPSQARNSK